MNDSTPQDRTQQDRTQQDRTAVAVGRSSNEAGQFLLALMSDTLDPGYRAMARRRSEHADRLSWLDRPAVAFGCLLIGFVLVVAYVQTHRGEPAAVRVHDSLVERVRAAQGGTDDLAAQLGAARRALASAQASVLPTSGALARLRGDQQAAGSLAVHGPGLEVTLSEPVAASPTSGAGRAGTTPLTASNILTDRDVRSVVNELWHDGAEAIAVNGVRLTVTSAIRFAGEAVLVDFQPITSPYVISAIGNADTLATDFAQSGVASRYQTLVSADGIGFRFSDEADLSLPAGSEVSPRYASVSPGPSSGRSLGPSSGPSPVSSSSGR